VPVGFLLDGGGFRSADGRRAALHAIGSSILIGLLGSTRWSRNVASRSRRRGILQLGALLFTGQIASAA
jgi:hypothetical protein